MEPMFGFKIDCKTLNIFKIEVSRHLLGYEKGFVELRDFLENATESPVVNVNESNLEVLNSTDLTDKID